MTPSTATPTTATPETRPAPVEVTTPLKASEAIRLGCLLAPVQAFGHYRSDEGAACVIGAAALAYGEEPILTHGRPAFHPGDEACPVPGCPDVARPMHLNDFHHWRREAIADFLASRGL